ncbi:uncharacterized protein LOC124302542 [Neodiprion virginianus]|uniref:uncharacterized protein LOC124302542 n=1 Tax=Neodiprion virginianus TaxID=2961670 RepID=UPI001EE6E153|nr:uncharacterized protein LOC124302542 [Neodiprion virginianus]
MLANTVRWTTIVLVTVGFSVRPSFSNLPYVNTSCLELRKVPYQESYTKKCWLFFTCDGSRTGYIIDVRAALHCERESGKNETAYVHESQRSVNKSRCDSGLEGEPCDEPDLCVIAELDGEEVAKRTRNDTSVTNWQEFPACRQKCLDELRGKVVHSTQILGNITYHLIPAHSQCNATETYEPFYAKHTDITAAVILAGITFLFGIISTACILRRKKGTKVDEKDTPTRFPTNEYNEENALYVATGSRR